MKGCCSIDSCCVDSGYQCEDSLARSSVRRTDHSTNLSIHFFAFSNLEALHSRLGLAIACSLLPSEPSCFSYAPVQLSSTPTEQNDKLIPSRRNTFQRMLDMEKKSRVSQFAAPKSDTQSDNYFCSSIVCKPQPSSMPLPHKRVNQN